jgi:hypothetical protein
MENTMKAVRYFALRVLIVSTTVLLGAVSVGYGRVIYVEDDANGLNNGSLLANAYKFLQDAIANANSGGKAGNRTTNSGIRENTAGTEKTR